MRFVPESRASSPRSASFDDFSSRYMVARCGYYSAQYWERVRIAQEFSAVDHLLALCGSHLWSHDLGCLGRYYRASSLVEHYPLPGGHLWDLCGRISQLYCARSSGRVPRFWGWWKVSAKFFAVSFDSPLTCESSCSLPVDGALFLEFIPQSHQWLLTLLSAFWSFGMPSRASQSL